MMNKELIENMRWEAKSTVVGPTNITYAFTPDELEKYTELVVQECLSLMTLELRNMGHLLTNPPQNAGIWDARNAIRKRFGVE